MRWRVEGSRGRPLQPAAVRKKQRGERERYSGREREREREKMVKY
jgi:hypothetical protein